MGAPLVQWFYGAGRLRGIVLYGLRFDLKLDRMVDGNFANLHFPVKYLLKDVRLFLKEAGALDTGALAESEKALEKAIWMGLAEMDYSAIFSAVSPE